MAAVEEQYDVKQQLAWLAKSYEGTVPIDPAVQNALPEGVKAVDAYRYGLSAWSLTAKMHAVDKEGKPLAYFLKYVPGELGRRQLEGEYVGMTELHKIAPNFVVEVVGWGQLKDIAPACYFLLVVFKDFIPDCMPNPAKLGARVAEMHKNSVSTTGMFGFHIQTFDGARLQSVGWDPSWTSFFSKLLAEAYRQDTESNGIWPQLDRLYQRVQSHLIPRLIGALESEGRSVRPTLLHGDMWEGNVGTERGTGNPWIFDCAAYYGHHEMELAIWRADRHRLRDRVYYRKYLGHYPASEPRDEWDDRNRLYRAKTNFMFSACFPNSLPRKSVLGDFEYLIEKYVPWSDNETVEKFPNVKKPVEVQVPVVPERFTLGEQAGNKVPEDSPDVKRPQELVPLGATIDSETLPSPWKPTSPEESSEPAKSFELRMAAEVKNLGNAEKSTELEKSTGFEGPFEFETPTEVEKDAEPETSTESETPTSPETLTSPWTPISPEMSEEVGSSFDVRLLAKDNELGEPGKSVEPENSFKVKMPADDGKLTMSQ